MFGRPETILTVEGFIKACDAEIAHRYGGRDSVSGFDAEAVSFLRVQIDVLRRMLPPPPTKEEIEASIRELGRLLSAAGLDMAQARDAVDGVIAEYVGAPG